MKAIDLPPQSPEQLKALEELYQTTKDVRLLAVSLKMTVSPGPGTILPNQLSGLLQFRSTPLAPLQTTTVPLCAAMLAVPWTVVVEALSCRSVTVVEREPAWL